MKALFNKWWFWLLVLAFCLLWFVPHETLSVIWHDLLHFIGGLLVGVK